MIVTATSITDEQIRELQLNAQVRFERGVDSKEDREVVDLCDGALNTPVGVVGRMYARARCAEILNARAASKCPGREHRNHVADVCAGSCCTTCGGPIDENEECRCQ